MKNFISYNQYKKSLQLNETYESFIELQSLSKSIWRGFERFDCDLNTLYNIRDFTDSYKIIQNFIDNTEIGIILISGNFMFEKETSVAAFCSLKYCPNTYKLLSHRTGIENLESLYKTGIIIIDKINKNTIVSDILHELQHAYDHYRSDGKYINDEYYQKLLLLDRNSKEYKLTYTNSAHELSSTFVTAISDTEFFEDKNKTKLRNVKDIYKDFTDNIHNYHIVYLENLKKLDRKFFQYYHKIKEE